MVCPSSFWFYNSRKAIIHDGRTGLKLASAGDAPLAKQKSARLEGCGFIVETIDPMLQKQHRNQVTFWS
jgi:hypothetical protein